MADVTIRPGHVGPGIMSIHLWREETPALAVKYVTLTLDPGVVGEKSISAIGTQTSYGHREVSKLTIPPDGVWTITITLGVATGSPLMLDVPIAIMQCSNECW